MHWALTLAQAQGSPVHPIVANVAALATMMGALALIVVALINRNQNRPSAPPPAPTDGGEGEVTREYIAFLRGALAKSDAALARTEAELAKSRADGKRMAQEIRQLRGR